MSLPTDAPSVTPEGSHATTSTKKRRPRGILGLVMLFTGAAGLVYEYVLSTVFSYLLGSSIEQFSITIGIMFAMMGIGGWLQQLLKGPLVEYFIGAELLLVVIGGFSPVALQWAFAELPVDFGWIKFVYPALIGLLIGIEIPLVMRINQQFARNLSSNIAGTWAWDYIGGFLGVVAWILMLRLYVPITHISLVVAGCNLLVAVLSLVFFWRHGMLASRTSKIIFTVFSVVVVIALIIGFSDAESWSRTINQQLYDEPIALQLTTKYQNIVLTKGPSPVDTNNSNYQLYLNGNKQFSSADEAIYHEYLVHPAMHLAGAHGRVLILGGGDGMALREVLKYSDVDSVTLVDLDPGMIDLAKNNPIMQQLNKNSFGDARVHSNLDTQSLGAGIQDTGIKRDVTLEADKREDTNCKAAANEQSSISDPCTDQSMQQKVASVNVYTIDADRFISEKSGLYDVVIVDLPDPNSVELAKLYSQEFYGKVRRIMSPSGTVVVQATSPYHAKDTFLCIMRTMAAAGLNVLPYHDNVPSFGDWGWVLGSPSVSSDLLKRRAGEIDSFSVPTREVVAQNMSRALIFNKDALRTSNTEVSTLMRPVVYQIYTYEGWRVD